MTATTTSWLSRIDGCTTEQLDRMRDSLRDDLYAIHKKKKVLEEELLRLKLDISFIESNLTTLNAKLNDKELTDETFDKHKHLAVTDHAALRYIERIFRINVEGIKQDIINGFPDKIPVNSECIKTGKTVYRLVKDKDRIVIVTIIRKKQ